MSPRPDGPGLARELTLSRVAVALATRGYVTRTSGDHVTGTWDGFAFDLRIQDRILDVEGSWGHVVEEWHRPALLMATNDWNRDHRWPTCVTKPTDGGVTVVTRYLVSLHEGLSDEQLLAHLDCALSTGVAFLRALGSPP
ncbi:MAG: YbjN domain-containing protein [Actinomycetota bacterium]